MSFYVKITNAVIQDKLNRFPIPCCGHCNALEFNFLNFAKI